MKGGVNIGKNLSTKQIFIGSYNINTPEVETSGLLNSNLFNHDS